MSETPDASPEVIDDLVTANRILYHEKVLDGFGHISVRHDKRPDRFVMARHLAPGLVTPDDLITFDLDSVPVGKTAPRYYSERYIHGEVYKARPDVMSVVHCHSAALLPFGATKAKLLPIAHTASFLGDGVPVFDIRTFAGITDMLVKTPEIGDALARTLEQKPMVLMRGHGATIVGGSIKQAVYRSVYAMQNAQTQLEALRLGEVTYLDPGEAALCDAFITEVLDRPWALWRDEAAAVGPR